MLVAFVRSGEFFDDSCRGFALKVGQEAAVGDADVYKRQLQWAVFLTIVFTLSLTARSLLSPDSAGADLAASAGSAGTLSELSLIHI